MNDKQQIIFFGIFFIALLALAVYAAVPVTTNVQAKSEQTNTLTCALDEHNLTSSWSTTDGDGDPVVNITDWRMNETSIALLYFPFEASGKYNATDYSSGDRTNLTVYNGAIWDKTSSPWGASYECDGANDKINRTSMTETDLAANKPFSMSVWVRAQRRTSLDVIANIGQDGTDTSVHFIFRNAPATGSLCFDRYGRTAESCTATAFPLNVWTFVVGTYDGTSTRLYVDGTLKDTTVLSGGINLGSQQMSLCNWQSTGLLFDGHVDEFRFFNRTLTLAEVVMLNNTNGLSVHSDETKLGEKWNVCITPNDFISDGVEVCSTPQLNITEVCATDTCTYGGTGNWNINCTDGCVVQSNVSIEGNLTFFDNGTTIINATLNFTKPTSYIYINQTQGFMCSVEFTKNRGFLGLW